jgi:alginate O-acetyltransferase complex protein AlgI
LITSTFAILVFALLYWKVVPPRHRAASLLLFGLALYWTMASSLAINAALVIAVLLVLGSGGARTRAPVGISLALLCLLFEKYAGAPAFKVAGLSYVVFRLVLLCRFAAKHGHPPGLRGGIEYALFPPTFLSGPIEPYERFSKNVIPQGLNRRELFASLLRITAGLLKKLVLAEPLRGLSDASFSINGSPATLWAGLLEYSLFVYLDFSAYSDLAIGGARLFGYSIGENFNWPYLSASITEFWTRWHISLSQFLRDQVFMPLSARALNLRALAERPLLAGSLASFVTMTLCGLWHGDRLTFALWGMGHGLLLGLHQFHRQKVLSFLPARKRMKLTQQPVYRAGATLVTFLCVTLLWVPFRFDLDQSLAVYGRLFSVFFHSAM